MIFAKLGTAITIPFGPVLDSAGADFTTAVVAEVRIAKNNGTPAALNGSATLTHKEAAIYSLVLTASDISAVGFAAVTLNKATYLAPPVHLIVLPAKVYDSLVAGTDNLEIDLIQLLGSDPTPTGGAARLAAAAKAFADVATPVFTAGSVNQSGDAFARVGAMEFTEAPDGVDITGTTSPETSGHYARVGSYLGRPVFQNTSRGLYVAWSTTLGPRYTIRVDLAVSGGLGISEWLGPGDLTVAGEYAAHEPGCSGTATATITPVAPTKEEIASQVELQIMDEADSRAVLQAIVAKIQATDDLLDVAELAAIATACRDAILNRVLAGNHDTPDTVGKLLQDTAVAAAAIGTPLQADDYTAPDNDAIAAAVWAATTRTLSGASGGVGPTSGANLAPIPFGPIPPGQTLDLSAAISYSGQYATLAGTGGITYTIYASHGAHAVPVPGHSDVALTPASVLFDSLQSDGEAANYNFRFRPSPALGEPFPYAGHYLVVVTFTVGDQEYYCSFRGESRW